MHSQTFFQKYGIPGFIFAIMATAFGLHYFFKPQKIDKDLFSTSHPSHKSLIQAITVNGSIELHETIKISSLISGVISKILIKENDQIKKNQLLALIDNGQGDTQILIAQAKLDELSAKLAYQDAHCQRLKKLWQAGHMSDDAFEAIKTDHLALISQVKGARAQLKKAKLQFDHTHIKAPEDGTVIKINVAEGKGVAVDLKALFEIAKDLTKMKAVLNIDETDLSKLHEGQKINLTFDAYPDQVFSSTISKISYVPSLKDGVITFQAQADIDNSQHLLRPGMTTKVKIIIGSSENALAISSQAFYISRQSIKLIAKKLDLKVTELSKNKPGRKSAWVISDDQFMERSVEIGITDGASYEIISGLGQQDKVIVDVIEPNKLEKILKKAFKRF